MALRFADFALRRCDAIEGFSDRASQFGELLHRGSVASSSDLEYAVASSALGIRPMRHGQLSFLQKQLKRIRVRDPVVPPGMRPGVHIRKCAKRAIKKDPRKVFGPEGSDDHVLAGESRRFLWQLFGLGKRQLTGLSMLAGGVAGACVDAATLGHSLGIGAAIGAAAGGAGAYVLGKRRPEISISWPTGSLPGVMKSLLPKKGTITDVGCGYGFLPYMLSLMSEERIIIGTDYDEEKIATATNCFSKTKNISFFAADATECELPMSDAFILSDILHYLPVIEQEKLIVKCIHNLNPKGMLLIRDADSSMSKRHRGTRYTEFISTTFGFNKTKNKLEFVPASFITDLVKKHNLDIQKIDNTRLTSNVIYIVRK